MEFTDLLDKYLLALGAFNHAHNQYEVDPLRFAQDYRDTSAMLVKAKAELNSFFYEPQDPPSGLVTP